MKEEEIIEIDNKEYALIKEIDHGDIIFLYLVNINDEDDTMIRKVKKDNTDLVLPLDNEEEFNLASGLLVKEEVIIKSTNE